MTSDVETTRAPGLPRLGEPAPDFEARTTQGPRRLSDYHGRWLVLFSHPADFTPVCTTEFIGFARAYPEFQRLGCELLGLSVDGIHAHVAWVRTIEERFGVAIPFPVIADRSMRVSRAYGMIQPGASSTAAVRATFVIDGKGIVRALLYYPMTAGRSIAEIVRLVTALQTADEHAVAMPEGWQPGDDVIVPAPTTVEGAAERLREGLDCVDWWFCTKPLATP